MAKQTINIGATANDGTGDTLRDSFDIVNDNFTELYMNNTVRVNSASDFPTAAANIITLIADKTYVISGGIDIGADRFDTSAGNITILGSNPNVDNITTTTNAMTTKIKVIPTKTNANTSKNTCSNTTRMKHTISNNV